MIALHHQKSNNLRSSLSDIQANKGHTSYSWANRHTGRTRADIIHSSIWFLVCWFVCTVGLIVHFKYLLDWIGFIVCTGLSILLTCYIYSVHIFDTVSFSSSLNERKLAIEIRWNKFSMYGANYGALDGAPGARIGPVSKPSSINKALTDETTQPWFE